MAPVGVPGSLQHPLGAGERARVGEPAAAPCGGPSASRPVASRVGMVAKPSGAQASDYWRWRTRASRNQTQTTRSSSATSMPSLA